MDELQNSVMPQTTKIMKPNQDQPTAEDSAFTAAPCSLMLCPFCGGSPELIDHATDPLCRWVDAKYQFAVECQKCDVVIPRYETKEGLVKDWNTRTHKENSKADSD